MEFVNLTEAYNSLVEKVEGWITSLIAGLPNLFVAVLVVVLFWILAKTARKVVKRLLSEVSENRQIINLLATLTYVAGLAIGFFVGLGILNLDKTVTSLLAGVGIIGLALGFAFQDLAANFMSGILISIRRPFQLGDIVETNGFFGTVDETNLRSTIVRLPQGQYVTIPNKQVFDSPLTNFTRGGKRRIDLECGVSYGDDLEKAREVAVAAVEEVSPRDTSRKVEFFYKELGGSSINFVVRFWIDYKRQPDFLSAQNEAIMRIHKAFDEAGLTIPFPITTLDFGIVGGEPLSKMLNK